MPLGVVSSCVNLSEVFNLSEPQFSHLSSEGNTSIQFIEWSKGSGCRRGVLDHQHELASPGTLLE